MRYEIRELCLIRKYETYHGLSQVFQQKAKSAGCIRHGICSVQNDKGVECVIKLDFSCYADPVLESLFSLLAGVSFEL